MHNLNFKKDCKQLLIIIRSLNNFHGEALFKFTGFF